MNYKKTLALVTALITCTSAVYAPASEAGITDIFKVYAAESSDSAVIEEGSLGTAVSYVLYENGKLVVKGHGELTETAEKIENKEKITSLFFEEDKKGNITVLTEDAFSSCKNLAEVQLPEGLENIGRGAFASTALTEVKIPDTVKELGAKAFYDCKNLKKAYIGTGIKIPVLSLFYGCDSIKELTMPDLDTAYRLNDNGELILEGSRIVRTMFDNVDESGFYYEGKCGVNKITIIDGAEEISPYEFYFMESLKEISIPETVSSIGDGAFWRTGTETVKLPEKLKTIGAGAFEKCTELSEAELPEGLEEIGRGAFASTALTEVKIPDTVKVLGTEAFYGCENLKKAYIGTGITEPVLALFYGCDSIKELTMPNLQTLCMVNANGELIPEASKVVKTMFSSIDKTGFFYEGKCNVNKITIIDGAEEISPYEFYFMESLKEISIPETVSSIGDGAFRRTGTETVKLPEKLKTIGAGAFEKCTELSEAELPEGLEEIGRGAFASTALTEVKIPDTVKVLGTEAFYGCENLKKAYIGTGITEPVLALFYGCDSIKELTMPNLQTVYRMNDYGALILEDSIIVRTMFDSVDKTGFYYEGKCNVNKITVIDGSEEISPFEFALMNSLKEISIPETVSSIGDAAFWRTGIETVKLPEKLKTIGIGAFKECRELSEVELPEGLETIERVAFCSTALTEVKIPDSVKKLGYQTFGDTKLKKAYIGTGITEVVPSLFMGCDDLEELTMPNLQTVYKLNERGELLFEESRTVQTMFDETYDEYMNEGAYYILPHSLKKVNIIDGAEEISPYLFAGIKRIEEVYIPATVKSIGENTFRDSGLSVVHFGGDEKQWSVISENINTGIDSEITVHFNSNISEPAGSVMPGDVDGNNIVSAADIVKLVRALIGKAELTSAQKANADMNGDGMISVLDLIRLKNMFV